MPRTQTQNEVEAAEPKSWFSDVSWKTALIIAALSIISGGGAGAGIVATKAVAQTGGLTQDQADVRYLTIGAADQRKLLRDKDVESITKKIDEKLLTREVYEAYRSNDVERMERMEKTLERISESLNK